MDQLFLTLTTGIANGAVYGLIGLGLVIIFRSTDVMNFAMASLSTLAIYVALSAYGAGVGIAVALVVAVVFGALSGVVVREALIRPLGQGKLFAALVVTMGLSIIVEHLIGHYWESSRDDSRNSSTARSRSATRTSCCRTSHDSPRRARRVGHCVSVHAHAGGICNARSRRIR